MSPTQSVTYVYAMQIYIHYTASIYVRLYVTYAHKSVHVDVQVLYQCNINTVRM